LSPTPPIRPNSVRNNGLMLSNVASDDVLLGSVHLRCGCVAGLFDHDDRRRVVVPRSPQYISKERFAPLIREAVMPPKVSARRPLELLTRREAILLAKRVQRLFQRLDRIFRNVNRAGGHEILHSSTGGAPSGVVNEDAVD
jgi:hypothetical protein